MKTINDLHEALFKYGYFYNPLFIKDYSIDLTSGYADEYKESKDLLMINSKTKNGKNMYKEFAKKNYKEYVSSNVYSEYKDVLNPILEIGEHHFGYSIRLPLLVMAKKQAVDYDVEEPDFDSIEYELASKLPREIQKCEDMIINGSNSVYFDDFCKKLIVDDKHVTKEELKNFSFSTIVFTKLASEFKKDHLLFADLKRMHYHQIDDSSFFECFDTDKFLLLIAKMFIDKINTVYDDYSEIMDLFPQIYNYIHFVDELGIKYNPRIMIPKEHKKNIKLVPYTFEDLRREAKKVLEKHPDYTFKYVSIYDPIFDSDENDLPSKEEMEKEAVKYRYGESYQNITASWNFIKKGEVEKTVTRSYNSNNTERKVREPIDIDYRLSVFNKTDYVCQIYGKDKFKGYIGYIYPNGIVAFERFYDEDEKPLKDNNATYIMNINNFEYFSSLSKPEIIEYIKDMGNEDVIRKYHSSNWEKNIRKIVDNPNCDEEIKEKVKVVVTEGRKAKKLVY